MNENIVDVLIYLYENYYGDVVESESLTHRATKEIRAELTDAGFTDPEIDRAFQWLDELAKDREVPFTAAPRPTSFRVFSEEETARLDAGARGLLFYLEQNKILSAEARELVLERLLALDTPQISTDEFQWIILMVLTNRPGQEETITHLEDLVLHQAGASTH